MRKKHLLQDSWLDFNESQHEALVDAQPWKESSHFFQHVHLSSVALMKMALHAATGGNIEVMGLLQGRMAGRRIFVTDVFGLPVIGTETRVNAAEDAGEYTVSFLSAAQAAGKKENAVGWYHSHPGYGCWLSGIDVATQRLQQNSDPSVAIVVDPHRTARGTTVEIGAFRVCARGTGSASLPPISSDKMQDYGAHCNEYYQLPITVYRTVADAAALGAIKAEAWAETLQCEQPQHHLGSELVDDDGPVHQHVMGDEDEEEPVPSLLAAVRQTLGRTLTRAIFSSLEREQLRRRLSTLIRGAGAADAARLASLPSL